MKHISFFKLEKYRGLIFATGLFLLLDASVLLLNYYISLQIVDDAKVINLAARQPALVQHIGRLLYRIQNKLVDKRPIDTDVDSLSHAYKVFDETLDTFIYGGVLIERGQQGNSLLENADYALQFSDVLNSIQSFWQPYRRHLSPVVYHDYLGDAGVNDFQTDVSLAIVYANKNTAKLTSTSEALALRIQELTEQKIQNLRNVQAAGVLLAIVNFIMILKHFVRRLRLADSNIERSQTETQEILATVNEGLFLLDRNLCIGGQYSASLTTLFQLQQLAGKPFLQLLRPVVKQKIIEATQEYLHLLFSNKMSERRIRDLNPLNEIEVNLEFDKGRYQSRYFSFAFRRVLQEQQLLHVLVTVTDISKMVMYRDELKRQHVLALAGFERHGVMLDAELSEAMILSVKTRLQKIYLCLCSPASSAIDLISKLDELFQQTQNLKCDLESNGLKSLMVLLHEFERVLLSLTKRTSIRNEDFLDVASELAKITLYLDKESIVRRTQALANKTISAAKL